MTSDFWKALQLTGAIADLSGHIRLRLAGPDAIRYLNGQVTQDVRKIRSGLALPACVTNHKGKLEAFVHLTNNADGALCISAPGDLRELLPQRLEKYLIADNCALEDLTKTSALVHILAPLEKIVPFLIGGEVPAALTRFGPPGFDLWITSDRLPFWLGRFQILTSENQSVLEVLYAIPAWGYELTPDLLPPEAGLDATAIDYQKGCYIGQEVISRLRSVGRVNRRLTSLIQIDGPEVVQGDTIRGSANPDADPIKTPLSSITRTARHPVTSQIHALAFLHRNTPEGPLLCGPANGPDTAVLQVRKSLDD